MPPLSGKVAIVTGSSRGIGRAIAMRLAADGATVMLTATNQAALQEVQAGIEAAGGRASSMALDLRRPEAASELVQVTLQRHGGIDIVVNNAGATKRGDFMDLTDEDWMDGFALKFFGMVRLLRAAWSQLKERRGAVVNIAGIGGRTPGPQFTIGGSVNAGMLSFTKAMADLGVRDGVQVNAINPGAIRTARLSKRLEALAKEREISLAEAEAQMVAETATTRVGEPQDVANLVAYLVAPGNRFLHGALVDLDGGATKSL